MKKCGKCKEIKPLSEYHNETRSSDGKTYRCKPCAREAARRHYCPKRSTDYWREKKYGVTPEQWDLMLKRCGNRCEICGKENKRQNKRRALCVDHNHETGEVRGLLCDNCNVGIGKLQDNVELLKKAAVYLQERGSYG